MKRSIVQILLITAALMLSASPALAADSKSATPAEAKAIDSGKAAKAAKAADKKAVAPAKLVDINQASKAELKKLPGIGETEADKIIAGRPYLSKANLVTQNILTREVYEKLKALVIAKQNKAAAAKLAEKQKAR